jgi:hypothetical protein
MSGVRHERGATAVESLFALPILLFIGLGVVQIGLLFQARHALGFAVLEAARAGSLAHAAPLAVREGLARGLLPWLHGAADLDDYAINLGRSLEHVLQAEARGRLRLVQVSPTTASFDDWAEPALDAEGATIDGMFEIPNDNLVHRARATMPGTGVSGARAGEPIGRGSGQTLADANLLRLRLDYAVPLSVPVVGRLTAWTLRAWRGCEPPTARTWGALRLDAPSPLYAPDPWACAMLGAGTPGAAEPARLPVTVSATVRMQTPAREAGAGPLRASDSTRAARGEPTASDRDRDVGGDPGANDPGAPSPASRGAQVGAGPVVAAGGGLGGSGGATPSEAAFCRTPGG